MSEILEHKSKPCDCCDGIGTGNYNRNGTSIHIHEQNRQENLTEMSKILERKSKPKAKYIQCDRCNSNGTGIYNRNGISNYNREQTYERILTGISKVTHGALNS